MLELIYSELQKEFLKFPDKAQWLQIANDFEKKKKFPNCIGAIDGKHIRIKKPSNCGSLHYNYKLYHSVVLLSLVDSNYKFTMIDVGAYGKNSDGGVLKKSEFGKRLSEDLLDLPDNRSITKEAEKIPYVIVADEAFQLTKNIMKPYPRKQLSKEKRIFNYRLSYARSIVECTFGILVSKFRIFETSIAVQPETCDKIIKAACVLHNMIRTVDCEITETTTTYKDTCSFNNFDELFVRRTNQSTRYARHIREVFTNYFCKEGALEFQDTIIANNDNK
ncbi:hypothetical protein RI129_008511 [Pyrocoelia pectoralis]|uniref:DDE Tnp4 domain-containing protein n=1 Tax=Pyrocoelia pectoralis TaxID=417401 RepID=A0AAN7VE98_9COLE